MDDALRWYVKRALKKEEEPEIKEEMNQLKEKHSEIQIAALIAVYVQRKTIKLEDIDPEQK